MELDPDMRMELLRDHDQRPRHYERLDPCRHVGLGYNPRCGDKYSVFLEVEGEWLRKVRFMGWGCAVSKASASIMCEAMEGRSVAEGRALLAQFRMLTLGQPHGLDAEQDFDLLAFEGIHQNPLRQRCATLAWDALEQAMQGL